VNGAVLRKLYWCDQVLFADFKNSRLALFGFLGSSRFVGIREGSHKASVNTTGRWNNDLDCCCLLSTLLNNHHPVGSFVAQGYVAFGMIITGFGVVTCIMRWGDREVYLHLPSDKAMMKWWAVGGGIKVEQGIWTTASSRLELHHLRQQYYIQQY
jgi:hypothetical protein